MASAGQSARVYSGPPDRFRSFAERYIIARAETFTKGKELEEGWQAIQDAKKLYQMTNDASRDAEDTEKAKEIARAQQELAEQQKLWEQQQTQAFEYAKAAGVVTQPLMMDPEILQASINIAQTMNPNKEPSPTLVQTLYRTLKGNTP
jgi:hypothetical protein